MVKTATESISLTDLMVGARARLLSTRLDTPTRSLLRALGLTDACQLRVCKRGEPFIIQVRSTRIGLSRAVASGIIVGPLEAATSGHQQHEPHGASA